MISKLKASCLKARFDRAGAFVRAFAASRPERKTGATQRSAAHVIFGQSWPAVPIGIRGTVSLQHRRDRSAVLSTGDTTRSSTPDTLLALPFIPLDQQQGMCEAMQA